MTVNGGGRLNVWGMTEETRAQIWAEAMAYTAEGEDSFLDAEMEKEAAKAQQAALEYDDREGQVLEYLETLLPDDWYSWDTNKRVDYFMNRTPWRQRLTPPCRGSRCAPWRSSASALDGRETPGKSQTAMRSRTSWRGSRDGKEPARGPGLRDTGSRGHTPGSCHSDKSIMADLSQALTPDEVRQAKLSPKLSPELSRAETREKAGKYAGCDKCDKYFLYRYSF